ncbi:MAG TPA: hypothetical protein ENI87_03550 [bacterium]|nr:hypothetical protein [bacterium]
MTTRWAITYFGQPRQCAATLAANRDKLPGDADVFFHLWRPTGDDVTLTSNSRFTIETPAAPEEAELLALYEPREHVYEPQRAFSPEAFPHLEPAPNHIPPKRVMSMLYSLQIATALAARREEYDAVLALRTDVLLGRAWPDDAVPAGREVLLSLDQGTVKPLTWKHQNPAHLDFLAAGTPRSLHLYASCYSRLDRLTGHWVPEFLLGDNLVDLALRARRIDLGKLEILR